MTLAPTSDIATLYLAASPPTLDKKPRPTTAERQPCVSAVTTQTHHTHGGVGYDVAQQWCLVACTSNVGRLA